MRAWRSSDGFVLDLGPSPEPFVAPLAGELPAVRRDYARLDLQGRPLLRCECRAFSIEDQLGATVYELVDGALLHHCISVFTERALRVHRDDNVIVDGLQEVPLRDVPLLPYVQDEAKRVGRIDFCLGPEFRRAQELTAARARNELDVELLRTLELFGTLARQRKQLRPALDAYLRACAYAAEAAVVEVPPSPAPAGPPPPVAQAMAGRLAGLETLLKEHADGWERHGADEIARALRRAAVEVDLSRKLLC